MKALMVHNSDEVKACFIGETEEEILGKLKLSEYWEDIVDRLKDDGVIDRSMEEDIDLIKMDDVTSLYHDGDSEDGYTLLDTI